MLQDPRVSAYYREQAAECEALAAATSSARTRVIMLDLARQWTAFATARDDKASLVAVDRWSQDEPAGPETGPLRPNRRRTE